MKFPTKTACFVAGYCTAIVSVAWNLTSKGYIPEDLKVGKSVRDFQTEFAKKFPGIYAEVRSR